MPTISTNKELLNVINEDVKNVKQFTKMPAISDELYMNSKEKQLSEDLQDKLYYNLYNPKDGVAQTNTELPDLDINLSALYDIHTEKDTSI